LPEAATLGEVLVLPFLELTGQLDSAVKLADCAKPA
jgi:hypothetical protein